MPARGSRWCRRRWLPLTMTTSGCPSPALPPMVPAWLTFTSTESVPDVVDDSRVGSAQGVEVDPLDVV